LDQEYDFAVLRELVQIIKERKQIPVTDSYTSSIIRDRKKIIEKLREESEELIEAKGEKNITWEAADLIYFTLVYLENRDVEFSEVLKELRERRK
jgi:phosphoribosyl-ATP pyrophosphohydrolase